VEARVFLGILVCPALSAPLVNLGLRAFQVPVDLLGPEGRREQQDLPEVRESWETRDLVDRLD